MSRATTGLLLGRVKNEVRQFGLLPFTDREAPSLVSIVAGGPVSGSWWGHPAGQSIYEIGEALDSDPNVLVLRLWRGKLTLLHRQLWPALLRVGKARAPWQMDGLGGVASQLLSRIQREETLRSDHLPADFAPGAPGFKPALRSLEDRLLVLTRSVHTTSGAHALEAESWESWSVRTRTVPSPGPVATARLAIEDAARRLTPSGDPRMSLPWGRFGRNARSLAHPRPSPLSGLAANRRHLRG